MKPETARLLELTLDAYRGYSALRNHGGGNPNHDAEGKFASGPGGGAKAAALARFHAELKGELAELRGTHKAERDELVKEEVEERKDLAKEHRKAVKAQPRELEKAKKDLAKEHASEVRDLARGQARERKETAKEQAKEHRINDRTREARLAKHPEDRHEAIHAAHAKAKAEMDERHPTEVTDQADVHEQEREYQAEEHAKALKEQGEEHEWAGRDLAANQLQEAADLRKQHREYREAMRERHKEERGDWLDQAKSQLKAEYPNRKGNVKRSAPDPIGPPRATRAKSILDHCLWRLGWADAYRLGTLTGEQRLALLEEVRAYARVWLRTEAEALFPEVETAERSIGGAEPGGIARFFGRAKKFVREAILAGVLALTGPAAPTPEVLAAVDARAKVQAEYLDAFHASTMAPMADETMTPAKFGARAEQYGACPWADGQNIRHEDAGRTGPKLEESRMHIGDDTPCAMCTEQLLLGWVPFGTLIPIGGCTCRDHCHCVLLTREYVGA